MFFGFLRNNVHPSTAAGCVSITMAADESITVNESTDFTVYANVTAGSTPISYQWQEKPPFGAFSDIVGATSSSYTKTGGLLSGDSGTQYKCNTSNACSSASRIITVTVLGELGGGGSGGLGGP